MFHHHFDESTEEQPTSGLGSQYLRKLWPYFRRYRRTVFIAAFLLLFSTVLSVLAPLLLRHAIDVDIRFGSVGGLLRTSLIYLFLQVMVFVIGYFQRIELALVGENAAADLKEHIHHHVLNMPVSFFDQTPVGKLITRVESDTEALKNLFTTTAVVLTQNLVLLVGMSVVMAIINIKLCLIILALLPPFAYAFWWFQKRIRPVYVEVRKKVAEINTFINETLRGLPVIQVFNQERTFSEKMSRLNAEKFQKEYVGMKLWYRVWFLVDFGEVLGLVFVLGLGGLWALKGWITIGTLFLFVSYIARLFGPLRGLSDQLNTIQRALASAERVFGILDRPQEGEGATRPLRGNFSHEIAFRGIQFAYEGRELVFRDLNLRIQKGEKVALVGETGGGKTSVVSLLLKFYAPRAGHITIDGQDLQEIEKRSLRKQVGFVPQEVILFPGSILDNLRLFDETIPEEQVFEATQRVHVHERILEFPNGYETDLIERGINLSVGERQLLAFARALVFNPAVLILDEATSSVDPLTEGLIQEGLEVLLRGRTAIIIAHRLATIQMVDRIVVVHHGGIVEEGTHLELLEKGGYYAKLYELQYVGVGA
jgi:ABC-type multidrug transport system fused ATPase/permease subunit